MMSVQLSHPLSDASNVTKVWLNDSFVAVVFYGS